jgi:hypothetical protein
MRVVLMDERTVVLNTVTTPERLNELLQHESAVLGMVVYPEETHLLERPSPDQPWTTIDVHKRNDQ